MPLEVKTEIKIPAFEKLIDLIDKFLGRSTKQKYDKQNVDTELYKRQVLGDSADEIAKVSNAMREIGLEVTDIKYVDGKLQIASAKKSDSIDIALIEKEQRIIRMKERLMLQDVQKQERIENIVSEAALQLNDGSFVDDNPLDEDWVNRFFNIAEDVSTKQMQYLFGRILAGEIKQPKTFSIRTINLLRSLSREDADLFSKVANFAFSVGNQSALFRDYKAGVENHRITLSDIAYLAELGILQPIPAQELSLTSPAQIFYGDFCMMVRTTEKSKSNRLPVWIFTKIGNELLKLTDVLPSLLYFKDLALYLNEMGTEVMYKKIDKRNPDTSPPYEQFDFPEPNKPEYWRKDKQKKNS